MEWQRMDTTALHQDCKFIFLRFKQKKKKKRNEGRRGGGAGGGGVGGWRWGGVQLEEKYDSVEKLYGLTLGDSKDYSLVGGIRELKMYKVQLLAL